MKQENKSDKIETAKKVLRIMQHGRATSDKRKQSIVNTKIIGNLYQANGGGNNNEGPIDNMVRHF